MAKSSHSKIVCATPHNDTQRKVTKPPIKGKAAPKPTSNRLMKGWGHRDDSPDLSKIITSDPMDPKNIIHGKRTRNDSHMNESQLGKATSPITLPDDDNISIQTANAHAASPTASRKHKDRTSTRSIEEPVPDTDSDNEPLAHIEEDNTEDKISAAKLRSSILALLSLSLQVTDDVLAYMQDIVGHEVHAQELERDVERVLTGRVKKRRVKFAA
ncbi:uncharacterized protein J4E78_002268 [Alternaria triticimaculans]|uniref:uncharacterized protein n=1 Tax=Alternaria triticimaculans TaxID=297637 RepID=UPI0020C276E2|nr:uncharacterized protein J4E78_002268 [Alternaria triticimaculans]KAI4668441.1 hypothetical protein J4E78_002268 [Alternaria triticimaculans]